MRKVRKISYTLMLVFVVLFLNMVFTDVFVLADDQDLLSNNITSELVENNSENTDIENYNQTNNEKEGKKNIGIFDLMGIGIEVSGENNVSLGFIVWAIVFIVFAIIVIAIIKVILRRKNRKKFYSTYIGKKRYKKNPYSKNSGRLLNDKYYKNRKYNK